MSVTLVVPTAGVSPFLRRSIENMIEAAGRSGPDAEVLVIINGSARVPALGTMRSPLLRVLRLDRPNVSRARNVGIAQARHDTVVFGDDGAEFPSSWCVNLAEALRDPRFPAVTAPVRVPVLGPVTAFLNYQRVFDAPPLDATEALTVTGALAIRRDRLPPGLRYDEVNLPDVGEDAAFGLALRAAGLRIRWLDGVTPARHLIRERIEEITERAFRYGGGAARVWCRRLGPVPSPQDVRTIYRALVASDDDSFRRFSEIGTPAVRAAYTLYDYLFSVVWLLGNLESAGRELNEPVVEIDRDGLGRALGELAARAEADLTEQDWTSPTVDFLELGGAVPAEPLIGAARAALQRYAHLITPRPIPPPEGHRAGAGPPRERRRANDRLPGLLAAWAELRRRSEPLDADAVDRAARGAGFGFREACGVIERAAPADVAPAGVARVGVARVGAVLASAGPDGPEPTPAAEGCGDEGEELVGGTHGGQARTTL